MGITHKLIPQIKEFILEQKKTNPKVSCRSLSDLIDEKFQIKVSKSSINAIFKESGLSMPVGRRPEGKRQLRIEAPALLENKLEEEPLLEKPIAPITPKQTTELPAGSTPVIERTPQPPQEPVIKKSVEPEPAPIADKPIEAITEPFIEKPVEPPPGQIIERPAEPKPEPIIEKPEQHPESISEPAAQMPLQAFTEKKLEEPPFKAPLKEFEKVNFTEAKTSGIILLKAADYLINGIYSAAEIIKKRLNRSDDTIPTQNEAFTLAQFQNIPPEKLEPITGIKLSTQDLENYAQEVNSIKTLSIDITRVIANCLEEVRCVKVSLSDGNSFYLDTQMHSIWSTQHIPYDFSSTIADIKRSINDYFFAGETLPIFVAPGYDTPSKDLFNFISGMDCINKKVVRLTLCGNRFEDIDAIPIETPKKYNYIFGAWPWQFVSARKVRKIGEFKPYRSAALGREILCAQLDIDFINPEAKEAVNLKGCALKLNAAEKTRLIILSNLPADKAAPEALCEAYLSRWPNLEESFQDYSRKIELFTYTAQSQAFFDSEYFGFEANPGMKDLRLIADNYLKTLDSFLRWHLLPQGYEKQNFVLTKARFYDLNVNLKKEGNRITASFEIPQGYQSINDLQYLCRRLNERNIRLSNGLRLWFLA